MFIVNRDNLSGVKVYGDADVMPLVKEVRMLEADGQRVVAAF